LIEHRANIVYHGYEDGTVETSISGVLPGTAEPQNLVEGSGPTGDLDEYLALVSKLAGCCGNLSPSSRIQVG